MLNKFLREQGLTLVRFLVDRDDFVRLIAIDKGGIYRTIEIQTLTDTETGDLYLEIID